MFKNNKNLLIVAIIAVISTLAYTIIIPIQYSYAQKFGLTDFEIGLLFAVFAFCQFFSSPLIGRLSDKYGRRPLLLFSLAGTAISLLMTAFAPNGWFLFLARALDGITAGNYPVVAAVIVDSTDEADRAKGFGIIGAAWSAGFVLGPAVAAITVVHGLSMPFIVAAIISFISLITTALFLPETNKHMGQVQKGKLFDFAKLFHSLFDKNIGEILLISFTFAISFALFIYVFQPFAVEVLHASAFLISVAFVVSAVFELITQLVLIGPLSKRYGERKVLTYALFITILTLIAMFLSRDFTTFLIIIVINGMSLSFITPLIQTLLSREVDEKSQGSIQGLNTSYQSIGNILGPLMGGAIATIAVPYPFLVSAFFCAVCFGLSLGIVKSGFKKETAF